MNMSAIILMILFIVVIWGGLLLSIVWLNRTKDEETGELGTAPGTDDETLSHRTHEAVA
ncbi:methionine/alanine import NSS transporter subunit MetS [Corynebacterium phoceense]|uniref:methionine/alanine import NSS transporter subunit MetS n=1 Tax=Corynebacterium phoceense TaxID=1686286 RepID=UPI00211B830A|nr:methionine/alanine import NSS transporter subunit MetS [Corynebacterium phoceense]MCQ9341526.1 methionine/alanine import NSS transporter subunit MetS [Corynebacterium phoceense]